MPYKPTGRPPGRPRKTMEARMETDSSVTQSADIEAIGPDLQAEIDRRVDEKLTAAFAAMKMLGGGTGSGASGEGAMAELLQSFAENMSAISAQANHKPVVAPAVKRARDAGYARMVELIVEAKANGHPPRYGLKATIQLNTRDGPVLLDPFWRDEVTKKAEPTIIEWPNVPCDAMEPKNAVAQAIYDAFLQSNTNVEGIGHREDAIGITAKGRVVYGNVVHAKEEIRPGDNMAREMEPDFNILRGADHHRRSVHKRVLGTTADPFVESAV